ncbi:MAG: cupin domain-containing protein [Planctomycetales bacterium]|nr:cupin domain-containing protein [Planctomycetales bacterium]
MDSLKPHDLIEHPEGGRFREVFRSATAVTSASGQRRAALTHIYFSLAAGEVSRFHRVASDEVWNLYRGNGLRLYLWEGGHRLATMVELSSELDCFCHVVPAGVWQAAEPLDEAVLVGCSVAPGFEFADFELIDPASADAQRLRSVAPDLAKFIET